jgi:hypothetical protein
MTEQESHTIRVLNDLHARHRRSLLPRLAEMQNDTTGVRPADLATLQRIFAEQDEVLSCLAEEIERTGGVVEPVSPDTLTSSLHFVSLGSVLPRAMEGLRDLVEAYRRAAKDAAAVTPEAADLLRRATARLEAHLEQLEEIGGR